MLTPLDWLVLSLVIGTGLIMLSVISNTLLRIEELLRPKPQGAATPGRHEAEKASATSMESANPRRNQ